MIERKSEQEESGFLTEQLITYIGNKRSLLPFIEDALLLIQAELGKSKLVSADLFSGSGVVARLLKGYASHLLVNDMEGYTQTINRCYLSNSTERDMAALKRTYESLRGQLGSGLVSGFISRLYAPEDDNRILPGERVFYTRRNAEYIDTARMAIEQIDKEIQAFFLAPLLYEASVKANTAGVFKGFYKNSETGVGQYGGNGRHALTRILAEIELPFPVFSRYDCTLQIEQRLAEEVATDLHGFDVVYIDPPYNQHPYGSNYFMLNLINEYREPTDYSTVSGIPKDWKRSVFNSKNTALDTLSSICNAIGSKYLLISFNSEGFVSRDQMEQMLGEYGELRVYEQRYNTFRGSRNLVNRDIHTQEYLYLLRKKG